MFRTVFKEEYDPLGPARGCIYGVMFGVSIWLIAILTVWAVLRD